MAFRFTELALHLLDYKFFDINGDSAPDLRSLIERNITHTQSNSSNSNSYLFNSSANTNNKSVKNKNNKDLPRQINPESGLTIILDSDGENGETESLLAEMISNSSTSDAKNESSNTGNSKTFAQNFQHEYSKIKLQMSTREEKFIKRNHKFIREKRIKPEYFFQQFYESEKANCIKDGKLLKHIFKSVKNDLQQQPNYTKLFDDITDAKQALEKILAKTSANQK